MNPSLRHLLEFDTLPRSWSLYPRVLLSRKPARLAEGGRVPRIEAVASRCTADPGHLARFRRITGDPDGPWLPLAYPHVLASRLHLAVLAAAAFPVRLMGLIHVRNLIVQRRPIETGESFEIRCGVDGHRETERGQEIDLESAVLHDGLIVWHETSTFLVRGRARRSGAVALDRERSAPPWPVRPFGSQKAASFRAETGLGRRYARLSGDFNLIHLSDATARLFGFRRAIAHGMWSLARCAAEIGANAAAGSAELDATFHAAILLPASLTLHTSALADGCEFALKGAQSERACLTGRLRVSP
jgi:acyl dehydratase